MRKANVIQKLKCTNMELRFGNFLAEFEVAALAKPS